jgi:hypothetical protein
MSRRRQPSDPSCPAWLDLLLSDIDGTPYQKHYFPRRMAKAGRVHGQRDVHPQEGERIAGPAATASR